MNVFWFVKRKVILKIEVFNKLNKWCNELKDQLDLIFYRELNVGNVQFSVFFNLVFLVLIEIIIIIYYNKI